MEEAGTNSDEVAQAVGAWLAASNAFMRSTQALNDAWRWHLEGTAEAPSKERIAEVAALRLACALALEQAQAAKANSGFAPVPPPQLEPGAVEPHVTRTRHRRRRENKFLTSLGKPGKRLLRAVLIVLLGVALLVATGAGISLALEIAGLLHLIDDPVQLPVGIQLVLFIAAAAVAYGLKKALKPVERALYGTKGIRPKAFQL